MLKGAAWWDTAPSGTERTGYIAALQADPCAYCGQTAGETDHITSRAHGGANCWDNYTAACRTCNSSKASLSLHTTDDVELVERRADLPLDAEGEQCVQETRQWRTYAALPPKAH